MRKLLKKNEGFTLVELLIVIAIIAILAVFLLPKVGSLTDKAKETGVKTDFRSFQVALEQTAREQSGFLGAAKKDSPGVYTETELAALTEKINAYLDPVLFISSTGAISAKDPWKKIYKFEVSSTSDEAIITSYGANGKSADATEQADDYRLIVSYANGQLITKTSGFQLNIGEQ